MTLIDRRAALAWFSMLAALVAGLLALAVPTAARAQSASQLHSLYAERQERIAKSSFGRPLFIESAETDRELKGDVYSIVEHPFAMVSQALRPAANWCDILMLHLNVKGCRTSGAPASQRLWLAVGKKFDQPLEDAHELDFSYRIASASADYLQVQLEAPEGPLGTRDYRIRLEAMPLEGRRTLLHMSYAYGYGLTARMALQAYLATVGRDKVGFSVTGTNAAGKPTHIGGVLGVVERNTMRYYLAIDAFLNAYPLPPAEQSEKRIHAWYASTERYATQLREMTQDEYLDMKRKEIRRQKEKQAAP